jgi:hypothetical protein
MVRILEVIFVLATSGIIQLTDRLFILGRDVRKHAGLCAQNAEAQPDVLI